MAEVTLKPEGQEPQAATPTQASKSFMGKVSDRIGKFIANESFIPYGAAIMTLASGIKGLVELATGNYGSALNNGTIAGISAIITSEVFPKSSLGTLIKKHVKEARQAYKDDLNNRHE